MQTSKISILVCALAVGTAFVVQAADNPAPAAARAAVAEEPVVMTPVNGEAKAAKAAAKAKVKQDAAQAAAEAKAQKEAAKKAAAKAKKENKKSAVAASAASEMKPIMAPASPIAAAKEQRLQALLVKYKADQVSPEEYQRERAAILAEP